MEPAALRRLRHELRTPCNHILGYAELLLEDVPEDADGWSVELQVIHASGNALLPLIADVIDALRDAHPADGPIARMRALLAEIRDACARLEALATQVAADASLADIAVIRDAATLLDTFVSTSIDMTDPAPIATPEPDPAIPVVVSVPGDVLVVDDNTLNRRMLSRLVTRLGHRVQVAGGGREGLTMMRSGAVDIVLLDVMMPEVDGYTVLAAMKADSSLRDVPVIMLSALDEVASAVRCIDAGADDYLTKPVDTVLLRSRLESSLERKRLRDTELAWLRQAAHVTGPAAIAQALIDPGAGDAQSPDDLALRAAIHACSERMEVTKGETLYRIGEPGDGMYVVLSGRLRIDEVDEGARLRSVGEAWRGATLGELEMITAQPRPVTITALRDSQLVRIDRDAFGRLAIDHPRTLTRATRDVMDRLRQAFQRGPVMHPVTTITLLPVSSAVPTMDTALRLVERLDRHGETLLLSRGTLADAIGTEQSGDLLAENDSLRPVGILDEIEQRHRFVIYHADASPSAWTRRCLRRADLVLLVGRAGTVVDDAAMLDQVRRHTLGTPVDLLLLHNPDTVRPSATGAWLDTWEVRNHLHLRLGDAAGLDHVVRRLTGTGTDVVLGGGGARGWAHVGVFRALDEAGIPVDAIGGTSMGALIGGAIAIGHDWCALQDYAAVWSSPRRLFDYTFPMVSFITGGKITRMLQAVHGDAEIEDTWRGFYSVSSSLTRAQTVVHRRGVMWRAVRASISLPGFLPPVHHDGQLLIDGSYLNNLPTDVMRDHYRSGTMIAVNVNQGGELPSEMDYGPMLSGWRLLGRRMLPRRSPAPAPGLAPTILKAAALSGTFHLDASMERADLAILPAVSHFDTLDFGGYRAVIDAGYDAASYQIEAWQRSRQGLYSAADCAGDARVPGSKWGVDGASSESAHCGEA